MLETIRIKRTDLDLGQLLTLLKDLESKLFRDEKKRVCGLAIGEGDDAGHNVIVIDDASAEPPAFTLKQFPATLTENDLAVKLIETEDAETLSLRCYGNVLLKDGEAVVAIFDPAPAKPVADPALKPLRGKMSTFGGPDDIGMSQTEDLAWIENEEQAAAYPGFFLPPRPGIGFGRRLNVEKFYLACRWDYGVTPKRFLAQRTTLCTVTNPANGKSAQAWPIDFGPSDSKPGAKDRIADLSPGLAKELGLKTDDICEVIVPTPDKMPKAVVTSIEDPKPVAAGKRAVIFLTGDYATRHVRQRQAAAEGCELTIDFHFNSNGSAARGGEVYFKTGHAASKGAAERLVAAFHNAGLPDHGNEPVKSANDSRAAFIDSYERTAVLLEPLFVSNPEQAAFIHNAANAEKLALEIAKAVIEVTEDSHIIGLSIGHLGKDSSPLDRGAECSKGDMEADHGKALAEAVAKHLVG